MLDVTAAEPTAAPPPSEFADDDLIRSADVRRKCGGISEATLWRWHKLRGFPEPDMRIGRVKYWRWLTVRQWIAAGKGEA